MPRTDRQRHPGAAGTVALLVGSALLGGLGLYLLADGPSSPPPSISAPSTSAPALPSRSSADASPALREGEASPAAVPEAIEEVARHFVLAWSGHEDSSYADATRRAASYASADLAEQLTTHAAVSGYQWEHQDAPIAVEIRGISVPDGAPAPTTDTAWVRVRYQSSVTSAMGRINKTDEQVTLKLQRDLADTWRVTALPYT